MAQKSVTMGIIGTGETSPEAATALIDDLLVAHDNEGRILLPVTREHFTETITIIADWLIDNKIPFEAITTDDSASARNLKKYLQAAEKTHTVQGIPLKMVNELAKAENGRLLLLWNDEDEECYDALKKASAKDVRAFDLTNALDELEFGEGPEDGSVPEGSSDTTPAAADEPAADDGYKPYTKDELEEKEFDELKQIVNDFRDAGFEPDIPPRSRSAKYIEQILLMQEEADTNAASETEPVAETHEVAARAETVVVNQSIDLTGTNDLLNDIRDQLAAILNKLGETLEYNESRDTALTTLLVAQHGAPAATPEPDDEPPATTMPRRVPARR